jgi:hypothetical protein
MARIAPVKADGVERNSLLALPIRFAYRDLFNYAFRFAPLTKIKFHRTGIVAGLKYCHPGAIGKRDNASQMIGMGIVHAAYLLLRLHENSRQDFISTDKIKNLNLPDFAYLFN